MRKLGGFLVLFSLMATTLSICLVWVGCVLVTLKG